MKVTKQQLKQIIKEELQKMLNETAEYKVVFRKFSNDEEGKTPGKMFAVVKLQTLDGKYTAIGHARFRKNIGAALSSAQDDARIKLQNMMKPGIKP